MTQKLEKTTAEKELERLGFLKANPNLLILPNKEILRLSPSKMLTFQQCKRNFKEQLLRETRDEGSIYTEVGTAIHWVVEQINKGAEWNTETRLDQMQLKLIELCKAINIPFSVPPAYEKSITFLEEYQPPPGYKLISSEGKRVVHFDRYQFSYIVDAVWEREESGVKYLSGRDYKSGQRPKNHLQGMLYLWAMWHDFKEFRDHKLEFAYHMTQDDRLIWVDAENVIEKMNAFMADALQTIELSFLINNFPTKSSRDNCHFCTVSLCGDRHGAGDWG